MTNDLTWQFIESPIFSSPLNSNLSIYSRTFNQCSPLAKGKKIHTHVLLLLLLLVVVVVVLVLVFSPWACLAGTRSQSGDLYGSGTLYSGQVLGGSLPLLSLPLDVPTFAVRCLHVPSNASAPSGKRFSCGREWCPVILPK
jgi:hypothetical protein